MTYDLSEYLAPISVGRHLLLGVDGTNAYEVCASVRDGKGYTRFVKNSHAETLWFDERFIYRGLDTSGLPGEVYAQFAGDRYGAAWMKRNAEIGDIFKRHPDIRFYDANGNEKRRADGGVSYLKLVKHYESITFPQTGRPIADVLELNWTSDPDGHNVIETYWYARGRGLVGFDYFGDPPFHSRFGGTTDQQNGYAPLPNFNEPTPPPVEGAIVEPPASEGEGIRAACNLPNGVNLRKPGCGNVIGVIKYADEVTVWEQPTSACTIDGTAYTMIPVQTQQGLKGVAAQKAKVNEQWVDTFIPAKLPTTFTIKVPFRRYQITSRFNDPRIYNKKPALHEGTDFIDLNAQTYLTDPVIHVGRAGRVVKVDTDPDGYGLYVLVDFGDNWRAYYGHMAECYVRSGQALSDWQIIGLMGSSGNSTGKHTHLTLQHLGAGLSGYSIADVVDPEPYLVAA